MATYKYKQAELIVFSRGNTKQIVPPHQSRAMQSLDIGKFPRQKLRELDYQTKQIKSNLDFLKKNLQKQKSYMKSSPDLHPPRSRPTTVYDGKSTGLTHSLHLEQPVSQLATRMVPFHDGPVLRSVELRPKLRRFEKSNLRPISSNVYGAPRTGQDIDVLSAPTCQDARPLSSANFKHPGLGLINEHRRSEPDLNARKSLKTISVSKHFVDPRKVLK